MEGFGVRGFVCEGVCEWSGLWFGVDCDWVCLMGVMVVVSL